MLEEWPTTILLNKIEPILDIVNEAKNQTWIDHGTLGKHTIILLKDHNKKIILKNISEHIRTLVSSH